MVISGGYITFLNSHIHRHIYIHILIFIDESPGLETAPNITIDRNPNINQELIMTCNINGQILVPYTIHMEKILPSFLEINYSSVWDIEVLKPSHKTFYQCKVKAYGHKLVILESDLFFLDIKSK